MSQTPQKSGQKMCKSPKNLITYPKPDKMVSEYETLSTTCTIMGSNNIHLVKKPQILTSVSPAYSNPSPGYPPSPYSSPASLKSPSPSLKPPTPQPTFPVMQIIHNNPLLARPIQTQQQQNLIKLKPQLNILPKPSASPQPSPKPSVSPQIVIPTNQQATLMPTAQQLVLNQMPVLAAPGVQLIFRPQTTKLPTQLPTATATPHGLILQPGGQPLLQLQPPRSQPMVRVLTNGVQLAPPTTTYVTQLSSAPQTNLVAAPPTNTIAVNAAPKKRPKKKKQKFDLADIMKISGIGDEDDIQFESDTSQNDSDPASNVLHQVQTSVAQQQNQVQQNLVQQNADVNKKIGNIQISTVAAGPTINATATPLLQVLNQNFQGGVISNSASQSSAPQGIPFNPFIAPNFTINNGLMVQRTGGFKLTVGEDGRLILQHDPTLNQDLQSQLLLQSIFGLNGAGLVLQPSMDQQVHSQTVQTIQQQSVQTIQQQTVQSQTIQTVQQQTVQPQTVQHSLQTIQQTIQPQIQSVQPQTVQQTVQQTIQHQTVQSQPLSAMQQHSQPMQIVQPIQNVQPQIAHSLHSQSQSLQLQSLLQSQPLQTIQSQSIHSQPIHTSQAPIQPQPVLTQSMQNLHSHQSVQTQPVLKVQPFQKSQPPVHAVHPQPVQTIHHPPSQQQQHEGPSAPTSYVVNLTPDQLEQLKRNGQLTVNGQTIFMQRPNAPSKIAVDAVTANNNENKNKLSPKIKPANKKTNNHNKIQAATNVIKSILQDNVGIKNQNNVDQVVKEAKSSLIRALQSPPKHILPQNHVQIQPHNQHKILVSPKQQQPQVTVQHKPKVQAKMHAAACNNRQSAGEQPPTQEVERIIGQLLEENNLEAQTNAPQPPQQQQRVHTIQLTPQKQQQLKSIQVQIQTLLTRMTPGNTEIENALKVMFAEQQKILASGKLLPPAIYHNNQLTIVNPSGLGQQTVRAEVKEQARVPVADPANSHHQALTTTTTTTQTAVAQQQQPARIVHHTDLHHHHHNHQHPSQPLAPQQQHVVVQPTSTVHHHAASQTIVAASKTPAVAVQQQQQQQQQPVQQQPQVHHVHVPQQAHATAAPAQNRYIPAFTKAQLIEQQLNTDQNGAVKPDVHTPFRDKADACKRLIRYHCFDQPVLSQKDLGKADEIFELTARHFIDKFSRMVDKYRYLLLKESMRQVQTSELMMLDRMFVAEEQQAVMRMRQETEEASSSSVVHFSAPSMPSSHHQHSASEEAPSQDDYDEWACIQRELGCLQAAEEANKAPKRSASCDSRLETLKRFRVDKHSKKESNVVANGATGVQKLGQQTQAPLENNSIDEQVQSAIDSILNLQQSTSLDLDDAVSSILS